MPYEEPNDRSHSRLDIRGDDLFCDAVVRHDNRNGLCYYADPRAIVQFRDAFGSYAAAARAACQLRALSPQSLSGPVSESQLRRAANYCSVASSADVICATSHFTGLPLERCLISRPLHPDHAERQTLADLYALVFEQVVVGEWAPTCLDKQLRRHADRKTLPWNLQCMVIEDPSLLTIACRHLADIREPYAPLNDGPAPTSWGEALLRGYEHRLTRLLQRPERNARAREARGVQRVLLWMASAAANGDLCDFDNATRELVLLGDDADELPKLRRALGGVRNGAWYHTAMRRSCRAPQNERLAIAGGYVGASYTLASELVQRLGCSRPSGGARVAWRSVAPFRTAYLAYLGRLDGWATGLRGMAA